MASIAWMSEIMLLLLKTYRLGHICHRKISMLASPGYKEVTGVDNMVSGESVVKSVRDTLISIGFVATDAEVSLVLGEEVMRLRAQLASLVSVTEALTGGEQRVVLEDGSFSLFPRAV